MSRPVKFLYEPVSVFNDYRLDGTFCDAVIKVEDVEFKVHRIIMCKCSQYFMALFNRCSNTDKTVFDIPGLSSNIMRLIIEFAYTGSVSVTAENVQELLMAADQFCVMDVVRTCCNFLEGQLCEENCIGIFRFTDTGFFPELQSKAFRYILDHFEEVASHEEFLDLPLQQLVDILARNDLNVRKESVVYEAVLRWIDHKPEERKEHVAVLLSKVRLALTSMEYMTINVMTNEMVNKNLECLSIIRHSLGAISRFRNNRPTIAHFYNPLARPRLPNAILLAIGGWSGGNPTNAIEAYDVRADHWLNVTNHSERPRAYHGTAVLNGNVYCIGGFDRAQHFNSVRRFNLNTRTWHDAASMSERRCYVSVTVLGENIYALGGFDGHTRLNTAERYSPENNQWSPITPMQEQRSDASSATLHNRVYICGGFNGSECLQTAEYFVPDANQWTMISPMSSPRSGIGIAAYENHVYAVGGYDGTNRLRSAEAYNPMTNSWQDVATMLTPRSNFGIAVHDDLLFVVGGFNGFTTSYNVESFDGAEWTEASDMDIYRSAVSCCVVSGLPNISDFVVPREALALLNQDGDSDEPL
ncbi:kelch-like protein 10 isoform X2 [Clinocottus analis]|uniref:kelch-like protein 10 isoform X2 n=1 Tax=Clinocottus analis TaxID=304258 RepID=UPI0035C20202